MSKAKKIKYKMPGVSERDVWQCERVYDFVFSSFGFV
jgi:hypothetical protein